MPASYLEEHWYAAYTCAKHEKRVTAELQVRGLEHFLPLYKSIRRWKDRRVSLELPLFPGYVFVRIALSDRLRVLQIPSVVHLVGFSGLPAALPDEEMDILRSGLSQHLLAEPHPFLVAGQRVRVLGGPLKGLEGIVVRRKNSDRLVISVALIQRAIAVEVEGACLEELR